MGIDIHFHDTYIAVGHLPAAIAVLIVVLLTSIGALKLAKLLRAMLGS
jgi:hypothetical protein